MAASVWTDYHNRSCLLLEMGPKDARLIMTASSGILVYEVSREEFLRRFKEIDYDVERAAKNYVRIAKLVGASDEAMEELGKLTHITGEEAKMAKKKLPESKMSDQPSTTAKGGKPKVERGPSAASMFQDLILKGKMTDDEIFTEVAEKFGLDESKRRYVAWYRNHLKKQGKDVPEPKVPKIHKAEKAAKK